MSTADLPNSIKVQSYNGYSIHSRAQSVWCPEWDIHAWYDRMLWSVLDDLARGAVRIVNTPLLVKRKSWVEATGIVTHRKGIWVSVPHAISGYGPCLGYSQLSEVYLATKENRAKLAELDRMRKRATRLRRELKTPIEFEMPAEVSAALSERNRFKAQNELAESTKLDAWEAAKAAHQYGHWSWMEAARAEANAINAYYFDGDAIKDTVVNYLAARDQHRNALGKTVTVTTKSNGKMIELHETPFKIAKAETRWFVLFSGNDAEREAAHIIAAYLAAMAYE